MWTSGFFNSVNGDRAYNAQQMSEIFEGLITDGVYESVGDKMAVQPNSGMTIQIASGRGWFGKHWVNNDTAYTLTLEASDVTLNRYAAICVRVDESESVRSVEPYVKYGEYATNPTRPAVTRTDTIKEYCLAYVLIKAGATTITAANIEDTRGNNSVCGWVTGLIEQLSTTTLFEQWAALFYEWFEGLQDKINENTETMLVAALPVSVLVTLTTAGWTSENGLYKQTVTVTGMNTTKSVIVQPTSESDTVYSSSEVRCTAQGTNTLEFTAVSVPTESMTVNVIHMGV